MFQLKGNPCCKIQQIKTTKNLFLEAVLSKAPALL